MREGSPYFLDTCVPIYAAGREHPYKEPCARLVLAVAEGEIAVATDAEVIQELAYRFHAIDRREDGLRLAEEFLSVMDTVLPITHKDIARALSLQRAYGFLPPRDAIHVAVMEAAGLRSIVTADRHFDGVKEVERVDPVELAW
jgi:predicted nucleic acid-binding protein